MYRHTNLIRVALISFALFCAAMSLTSNNEIGSLYYWYALPISYAICLTLFPAPIQLAEKHIGMFIFNCVLFVRYAIIPLFFSLSEPGQFNQLQYTTEEARDHAFLIVITELILSFGIVQIFHKKFYRTTTITPPIKIKTNFTRRQKWALLAFSAISIAVLLAKPQLISRYNLFLVKEALEKTEYNFAYSGFFLILADFILVLPPLLILGLLSEKHNKTPKPIYYALAMLSIIPFMLIFKGMSRFSVLVPSIAWLMVLIKIFPKYKNKTIWLVAATITIVFGSITLYKQFGYTLEEQQRNSINFSFGEMAQTGNAYFSHIYNMAYVVDMLDSPYQDLGLNTIYHDLFANLALLSSLSDPEKTSTAQFNKHIYGVTWKSDQIIPMSGQGLIYFGPILFPILLVVSLITLMKIDSKIRSETRIEFVFLLSFMAIYLSMSLMLSANSIFPTFFNIALPYYIIFKISKPTHC